MAKYWITPAGKFIIGYGADIPPQNATEVPIPPPDETDIWLNGVWTRDPVVVRDRFNATVQAHLREADIAAIRSIREWVASQPTASQIIKDREAAQVALRGTLKP